MNDTILEKNGTRKFEMISRWNAIDYTIISDNNRFAKYADNYGNKNEKLTLTFFKVRNHTYPLNMFAKLMEPIQLEDRSVLSRQSTENDSYYLEINSAKDKVRVYKEIKE